MHSPLDDATLVGAAQSLSINVTDEAENDDSEGSFISPPKLIVSEKPDSPPTNKRSLGTLPKPGLQASPIAGLKLLMPKLAVDSTSTPVSSPANPNMMKCPLDERFASSLSSSLFMVNKDFDDSEDDDEKGSDGDGEREVAGYSKDQNEEIPYLDDKDLSDDEKDENDKQNVIGIQIENEEKVIVNDVRDVNTTSEIEESPIDVGNKESVLHCPPGIIVNQASGPEEMVHINTELINQAD